MGALGAAWGIIGLTALLCTAIYRLSLMTGAAFQLEFSWYHWLILIASVSFMAHAEGYKGFQLQFSPRFAARVRHLRDNPTLVNVLLAPLFCMGYYQTTRRRLISVYVLTIVIVAFIVSFQLLTQPLRGLLDAGVVVGLTWGLISIFIFCMQALTQPNYAHSPELPGDTGESD